MKVKNLLMTFTMFMTIFNTYAVDIEIPFNQVGRYVGSFSDLETTLKQKILEAAKKECGNIEDAVIGRSQITLDLKNIYTYEIVGDEREDQILGSYPQVKANLNIRCR